jgi:hypothetical protein
MKFPLSSMWLLACAVAALPPAAANTIANETLIVFDDPHLVATTSSKGIRGYFNMQHQVLPFYCSFLFKETSRPAGSAIVINSFPIQGGTKEDNIPGRVWEKDREWIIQTDEPHGGCGGVLESFRKGPNDDHPTRYAIVKRMPAMGIRVVLRTTRLNEKNGAAFKERKGLLVAGDMVVALEIEDSFTRIRYVHPATSRITTAWVSTRDLDDPFVPSAKN